MGWSIVGEVGSDVRVCLICVEIFAWGKYGGFGRATRMIGGELVKRGVEVFAVVPRRQGQKPYEQLDGMQVFSFSPHRPWTAKSIYRQCEADVYHSCEPSFGTYLAMKAMPQKTHVVTMRDTREFADWQMEYALPSVSKLQVLSNYLYEDNFFVRRAVRNAQGVYCAAHLLIPKVKTKYKMSQAPSFLPTPVRIPMSVRKAEKPTVCYMGRWDRRKRPELFLRLAKLFPEVRFIAVGRSRDQEWDQYLRQTFANIPNLEMPGFVDQFDSNIHTEILEKSWILVNTATREGLPNAFLEAAAHGCAILSAVDPDGFASQYGYHVKDERFDMGLEWLLQSERWKEKGLLGKKYVEQTFALNRAMSLHIEMYQHHLRDRY